MAAEIVVSIAELKTALEELNAHAVTLSQTLQYSTEQLRSLQQSRRSQAHTYMEEISSLHKQIAIATNENKVLKAECTRKSLQGYSPDRSAETPREIMNKTATTSASSRKSNVLNTTQQRNSYSSQPIHSIQAKHRQSWWNYYWVHARPSFDVKK
eukprot:PhF_6_TR34594/c0_g1_i1/m.50378